MLVDYACAACGRFESWVATPVPESVACIACGGAAARRFGFGAVHAGGGEGAKQADHGHDVIGSCALVPTAARALSARMRGDERALDREFRSQEKAISLGTLDPKAPVVSATPTAAHQH